MESRLSNLLSRQTSNLFGIKNQSSLETTQNLPKAPNNPFNLESTGNQKNNRLSFFNETNSFSNSPEPKLDEKKSSNSISKGDLSLFTKEENSKKIEESVPSNNFQSSQFAQSQSQSSQINKKFELPPPRINFSIENNFQKKAFLEDAKQNLLLPSKKTYENTGFKVKETEQLNFNKLNSFEIKSGTEKRKLEDSNIPKSEPKKIKLNEEVHKNVLLDDKNDFKVPKPISQRFEPKIESKIPNNQPYNSSSFSSYNAALMAQSMLEDTNSNEQPIDQIQEEFVLQTGQLASEIEEMVGNVNETSEIIEKLTLELLTANNEVLLMNANLIRDDTLNLLNSQALELLEE